MIDNDLAYFLTIIDGQETRVKPDGRTLIVVTHCTPDRPPFFDALNLLFEEIVAISIPYSRDPIWSRQIAARTRALLDLPLDCLLSPSCLLDAVRPHVSESSSTSVLDIGGYFAPLVSDLERLTILDVVVEDTEHGHRRYEAGQLARPWASVARSPLKGFEDALIGESVARRVEQVLGSKRGLLLRHSNITVVGYGKVGEASARSLSDRGANVCVFDKSPVRRLAAHADGFHVRARDEALRSADCVLGCTGSYSLGEMDLPLLRNEAILASASSKRAEFDLSGLLPDDAVEEFTPIVVGGQRIWLVDGGMPINYRSGAVVGDMLRLVQAELLAVLARNPTFPGAGLGLVGCEAIASAWLDHYLGA